MIGAGYVVVNSHLWRYTRQHGYALNSNRYLTAGIMLLGFSLLLFIVLYGLIRFTDWLFDRNRDIRNLEGKWFWVFWIFISVVSSVVVFAVSRQVSSVSLVLMTILIIAYRNQLTHAVRNPISQLGAIVFLVLLAYTVIGGFIFGRSFYWRIPYSLGGGQPPVIQVVFESPDIMEALQLPPADGRDTPLDQLRMSAPSATISDRLCLLAETQDGILVYNPRNRTTLSIKFESLFSIRDIYRTIRQINEEQQVFNCAPPELGNDLFGGLTLVIGEDVDPIEVEMGHAGPQ